MLATAVVGAVALALTLPTTYAVPPSSASPEFRWSLSASAGVGGTAIVGGGCREFCAGQYSAEYLGTAYRYRPGTGSLDPIGDLPSPRAQAAAFSLGSTAYFVGGQNTPWFDSSGHLDEVVSVSAQGVALLEVSLPRGAYAMGATAVGDFGVIAGGASGVERFDEVYVFDGVTGQLTTSAVRLPAPTAAISAATVGDRAYFFGGSTSGTSSARTDAVTWFDPALGTSGSGGTLPTARAGTAAIGLGGKIYVFGGSDASGILNEIVRYDPATGTSSVVGHLDEARTGMSVARAGNRVCLFGGETPTEIATEILCYRVSELTQM